VKLPGYFLSIKTRSLGSGVCAAGFQLTPVTGPATLMILKTTDELTANLR
jgi:hypothetical protein